MLAHLLLLLLLDVLSGLLSSLGLLSADTARAAATEGRGKGEVDVLLGIEADDEGRHIDHLLADADVALTDQDTGVVDGLGETELVDAGLQAALEEILDLEGQDVIELHAGLVKDTDADETANEGVTLKEALGILLIESEELTTLELARPKSLTLRKSKRDIPGSTTDLGQSQTDTPDLTLVAEAILADELKLRVPGVLMSVSWSQST